MLRRREEPQTPAPGGGASPALTTREKNPDSLGNISGQIPNSGNHAGDIFVNSQGSRFRWCPDGEFLMGSSIEEQIESKKWDVDSSDEKRHPVRLTRGFWLGECEVTQGEWQTIMGRSLRDEISEMLVSAERFNHNGKWVTVREVYGAHARDSPEKFMGVEAVDYPMYWVNWEQAQRFCERLTQRELASGRLSRGWRYSLPTEAQWEYACRATTQGATYAGALKILSKNNAPALDPIAWYGGNSSQGYIGRGFDSGKWPGRQYTGSKAGPRRVGQKQANAWGFKDMIGNVWEWCTDWYAADASGSFHDPAGPQAGSRRIVRGGAWSNGDVANCRASDRFGFAPENRNQFLGFRTALIQSSKTALDHFPEKKTPHLPEP
jgi:formylglycine-generating enzyme required for sulfatase activity